MMHPDTKLALKQSIRKWRNNAVVTDVENYETGADHCPLCELYLMKGCQGCPISEKTGRAFCLDTPYDKAMESKQGWWARRDSSHYSAKARKAAEEMVAFLEQLLKEAQ